jgi:hypothetical protein
VKKNLKFIRGDEGARLLLLSLQALL